MDWHGSSLGLAEGQQSDGNQGLLCKRVSQLVQVSASSEDLPSLPLQGGDLGLVHVELEHMASVDMQHLHNDLLHTPCIPCQPQTGSTFLAFQCRVNVSNDKPGYSTHRIVMCTTIT